MAQKAFIFTMNGVTNNGSLCRLDFGVSLVDTTAQTNEQVNSIIVDASASSLATIRAQIRDAIKDYADVNFGYSLGNDDVFFMDQSRELV